MSNKTGLVNGNAEVGDKVNCPVGGNGEVASIGPNYIRVKFGILIRAYTADGRLEALVRRTLRFGHDPAFEQPEELPFPERGTPALFSDDCNVWYPRACFLVDDDKDYPYKSGVLKEGVWEENDHWKYWKPWPTPLEQTAPEPAHIEFEEMVSSADAPWQPKRGELVLMGDNPNVLSPIWFHSKRLDGKFVAAIIEHGKFTPTGYWQHCLPYRAPDID